MATVPTPVPTTVAAVIIARVSGGHVAVEYEDLLTEQALDLPVTLAHDTTSPDGLYPEGPVPCDLLLYCDGSIGCYPDPAATGLPPTAVEQTAQWEQALLAFDISPPRSAEQQEDFEEWLGVMREEAAIYADDVRRGLSEAR